MSTTKEKVEKSLAEMSLEEVADKISTLIKLKSETSTLQEQIEELAYRALEFYTPVQDMSLKQLQHEIMKLDTFKCDVVKPFYKRQDEILERLQQFVGNGFVWDGDEVIDVDEGTHWQDDRGIVWATEKKTGTFIEFKTFGVTRTRDIDRGEKLGLSMSKARKFGYVVEGK